MSMISRRLQHSLQGLSFLTLSCRLCFLQAGQLSAGMAASVSAFERRRWRSQQRGALRSWRALIDDRKTAHSRLRQCVQRWQAGRLQQVLAGEPLESATSRPAAYLFSSGNIVWLVRERVPFRLLVEVGCASLIFCHKCSLRFFGRMIKCGVVWCAGMGAVARGRGGAAEQEGTPGQYCHALLSLTAVFQEELPTEKTSSNSSRMTSPDRGSI